MDSYDKISGIIFVVVFCLLMFWAIDKIIGTTRTLESCKDIGMEYHYAMDTTFCVDSLGNAHYAKFKCKGLLWNKECAAQLISIGDVRVR